MFVASNLGVWLGNPYGRAGVEKIFIPDTKPQDIRAVEALNKEATKFALALLDVFSPEKCFPDLWLLGRRDGIF